MLFEPLKRLLWKDPSSPGKFVDELKGFFRRKLSRSEYQKTAGLHTIPDALHTYASPNADLDTWDVTQAKLDGYTYIVGPAQLRIGGSLAPQQLFHVFTVIWADFSPQFQEIYMCVHRYMDQRTL